MQLHFDNQLLQQQLAKIKAMQEDITFLEKRAAAKAKAPRVKQPRKVKTDALTAAKQQRKELEKRAKEVLKAKHIQQLSPKAEKKFETRVVDLSEQVAVRIDARTVVYVPKGTDVEQVRSKYNARKITDNEPAGSLKATGADDAQFALKVLKPVDSARFNDLLEHAGKLVKRRTATTLDKMYAELVKYVTAQQISKKCKVSRHQEQGETWVICLEYGNTDRANATIQ